MAILLRALSREVPGLRLPLQKQRSDFYKCAFIIACAMCSVKACAQQSSDNKGPEDSRIEILASAWLQHRGVILGGSGNLNIDLDKALAEAALRGCIVVTKAIGKLSIPRPDQRRRRIDKRESTL